MPTPFSKLKPAEKFARKWEENGLVDGTPEREYLFHGGRRWRFDFAWPLKKVAVEIDGFGFGHQAQQRLANNHEKQNVATEMGWRVLRYTSRCLGSHASTEEAVEQVCRVLCGIPYRDQVLHGGNTNGRNKTQQAQAKPKH